MKCFPTARLGAAPGQDRLGVTIKTKEVLGLQVGVHESDLVQHAYATEQSVSLSKGRASGSFSGENTYLGILGQMS